MGGVKVQVGSKYYKVICFSSSSVYEDMSNSLKGINE